LLGIDIGANPSIRANGEVVITQLNVAFHLSVDIEIFAAGKLAPDDHRPPEVGYIASPCFVRPVTFHRSLTSWVLPVLAAIAEHFCAGRKIALPERHC
jgi:hypothetical protein